MTHPSWAPHGAALRAFLAGREDAEVVVRGEDGEEERTPARVFFRGPKEFSSLEEVALDLCRGRVLDVGAGAGCHSLVLQERGLAVVAIDVAPEAVEVMRSRGVRDVRCGDVFAWAGGRFDTLLILMNGIGLVGSLDGLDRFLRDTSRLLNAGGQILLDSYDPGEPDQKGGLLYARYGKGVFIYTAYAWFRQLPAGVPGAFRIFANLISAGKR